MGLCGNVGVTHKRSAVARGITVGLGSEVGVTYKRSVVSREIKAGVSRTIVLEW